MVNILLHAASGLLLWRILRRLGLSAAWFAAALFALHPVHVESVAWIAERKNVLSGFFYLGAALAYLQFRPVDSMASRWRWYAVAARPLHVLALLSKTVTCSLPAALLLVYWWKRPRLGTRDIVPLVPMFVLGAGMAYVTVWMERHKVGATGLDFALTPTDRILIAGRAVCFYLGKLVWPTELAFIYPRWTIDPDDPVQWMYPIAVVIAISGLWLQSRWIGRGPLVAMLFFVGTLFPALGFIDVYPMKFSFVADHFQYLACIGPLTLFAAAGKAALERLFRNRPGMPALIGTAWLVVLGLITFSQISIYESRETLWTDTIEKNPDCWLAHQSLGELAFERSDLPDARKHYEEVMRIRPDRAALPHGIGKTYFVQHDLERAEPYFEEAVRLKPDFAEARYNLGCSCCGKRARRRRSSNSRKRLASRPEFADAHNNLGVALAFLGRSAEAIPHFRKAAAELQPGNPQPLLGLATAYAAVGRTDEARAILRRLALEHPRDTKYREMLDSRK